MKCSVWTTFFFNRSSSDAVPRSLAPRASRAPRAGAMVLFNARLQYNGQHLWHLRLLART